MHQARAVQCLSHSTLYMVFKMKFPSLQEFSLFIAKPAAIKATSVSIQDQQPHTLFVTTAHPGPATCIFLRHRTGLPHRANSSNTRSACRVVFLCNSLGSFSSLKKQNHPQTNSLQPYLCSLPGSYKEEKSTALQLGHPQIHKLKQESFIQQGFFMEYATRQRLCAKNKCEYLLHLKF